MYIVPKYNWNHSIYRFGDGYTLQAKVSTTKTNPVQDSQQSPAQSLSSPQPQVLASLLQPEFDTSALKNFIQQTFPGAMLMEEHQV